MKLSCLMCSVVLCAFSASNVSAQLVFDGDFELPQVIGGGWTVFGDSYEDHDSPGIDTAVEGMETLKVFGDFDDTKSIVSFAGAYQDIEVDGLDLNIGDLIVLSGIVGHISTDAIAGANGAYLEVAFVDSLDNEFGAFVSAEVTSSSATDTYFNLVTEEAFVPTNAASVRVKAIFRQDAANSAGAGWYDNLKLVATPEPGSAVLFLTGCFALLAPRRRV